MGLGRVVDAIIIGSGLAGLSCASSLFRAQKTFIIVEQADGPGGRVRTDNYQGFLLDRGFQVLLTSYAEARAQLDFEALGLMKFAPGALIRHAGKFYSFADPWRQPLKALRTLASPIGTLSDKLRIGWYRSEVCRGSLNSVLSRGEQQSALERLRSLGFSDSMIDRFFKPFFSGVFLEDELTTSSRMLDFCFRMFALGDACLPQAGMGAIPQQLAASIPLGWQRYGQRVEKVERGVVTMLSGERWNCKAVVVATDGLEASRLVSLNEPRSFQSVYCLYFSAPHAPFKEPLLVVNSESPQVINNLCVLSNIAPSYSPDNQALIVVNVLPSRVEDSANLEQQVLNELRGWYGDQVTSWTHLRTYLIPRALPTQSMSLLSDWERPAKIAEQLYICGDHRSFASIEGALLSGRKAAEAVIADLAARSGLINTLTTPLNPRDRF